MLMERRQKMKRNARKFLSVFLMLMLAFSLSVACTQADNESAQTSGDHQEQEEFFEDAPRGEEFVKDTSEYLLSKHGETYWNNLEQARENDRRFIKLFPKDSRNEPMYPDFIGGVYYNDDGNMVLQIVESATTRDDIEYSRIEGFIAEANGLIIEYVEFSYNELICVMDALNDLYLAQRSPQAFENVSSYGIDTRDNKVEVQLLELNAEQLSQFRNDVFDSPIIVFMQSPDSAQTWTTANP